MFYNQDSQSFIIRIANVYDQNGQCLWSGWSMFYDQDGPCFMIRMVHVL